MIEAKSFKKFFRYLSESDPEAVLQEILDIMDTMSEEDIDEFGWVIYQEFFDPDPENPLSGDEFLRVDDVDEMIKELGPEVYEDILDLLDVEDEDEDDPEEQEDGVEESVSRRLTTKRRNRKKRKYMKKSRAELRRSAAARKRKNRETRQSRKNYYRKNKKKISAYQKSRRDAIKKGKHKPKTRRNT